MLVFTVVLLFSAAFPNYSFAANNKFTCKFYANYAYDIWTGTWNPTESHTLYVSTTQSLYEYYQDKNHNCYVDSDYPKFVTIDAVKPVADSVWSICQYETHSEEQFTNAILMLVHQIPYVVTNPPKYPVETIVEKSGDCDVFSLLAASALKAKGFDVVLLEWIGEAHMSIGVGLSETPAYTRGSVWYMTVGSKKYYIAECTGYCSSTNVTSGWRVGECPDNLKGAEATIIDLSNCETSSPAQVSARSDADLSTSYFSALSCSPPSPYYVGEQIQIQGTIAPAHSGKNVVLYFRKGTASWAVIGTTVMDYSGAFSFVVNFDSTGTYYLRASWSGDIDHEGADSSIMTFDASLAPSYISLALTPFEIHLGDSIDMTGYLSPIHSYQNVKLYYRQNGYDWTLLSTVTTDSEGHFLYQWTPDAVGTFYFKAEWLGDLDHQGATSDIGSATVSKTSSIITIAISSWSINLGESVTLSGDILPIHGNVNVDVYVSRDEYQWSFLTSITTDTQGHYVYQWNPTSQGVYYFKADWSGDTDHAGDESNVSTLQVNSSTIPDDQGTPNPPAPDNQNPGTATSNYILIVLAVAGACVIAVGVGLLTVMRKRNRNLY